MVGDPASDPSTIVGKGPPTQGRQEPSFRPDCDCRRSGLRPEYDGRFGVVVFGSEASLLLVVLRSEVASPTVVFWSKAGFFTVVLRSESGSSTIAVGSEA